MIMTDELLDKLIKYNKIQSWSIQMASLDWLLIKKSKHKGFAWFKGIDTDNIIETRLSNIETIGGMTIEKWLNGGNMDKDGNLIYLEIDEETDYNNNIKGKKEYFYKEIPFINDMSVVFNKDVDSYIRGKVFRIKGVGTEEGIQIKNKKGRPRTAGKKEN